MAMMKEEKQDKTNKH